MRYPNCIFDPECLCPHHITRHQTAGKKHCKEYGKIKKSSSRKFPDRKRIGKQRCDHDGCGSPDRSHEQGIAIRLIDRRAREQVLICRGAELFREK